MFDTLVVRRFYQFPGSKCTGQVDKLKLLLKNDVVSVKTEHCYYVEVGGALSSEQESRLRWLLTPGFEVFLGSDPHLKANGASQTVVEIGPRLSFQTPSSTQAVGICSTIGLDRVTRIERATRFHVTLERPITPELRKMIVEALHDRMTEQCYEVPLESFKLDHKPEPWTEVDILSQGCKALEECSAKLGLSFDNWDLDFYTDLFKKLGRNPTTVECFDLAQSNSEHSRHWFFKGKLIVNGKPVPHNLFKLIQDTQLDSNSNNVIKFSDNSSAIKGFDTVAFQPLDTTEHAPYATRPVTRHIIFTAETHNFPTGVAPFSGATTGTGGRLRDVQAAGRGAHEIAGTAGYSFGNLRIPGYNLSWEDDEFVYPPNLAPPLEVAVEASNGASDYGNKFGEPVLSGFARSFGLRLENGERREWIKPIMFSGGIGQIDGDMITKEKPQKGMLVVKIGGPVYRIGVGGGAASSVVVQGDQSASLDFDAVQRGDAEMEQKLHRVVRACIERGSKGNPILSIHDQGAGGNGNVLKEIVEPAGAVIYCDRFQLGDPTISTLELWGAEYQENNAILINPRDQPLLSAISQRERCPVSYVGEVTGDGRIVLREKPGSGSNRPPVDLDLESVLGDMPQKTFDVGTYQMTLKPLVLPSDLSVIAALDKVLRLPSVASKRYLTNKVDRCVTGLVAQQQCVGPLHTPLADCAVVALGYFDKVGSATSIGEQPIKGLLSPSAGARMSVAEAVTNLLFARITSLQDVKCSGNWMWAAKLPGEGAALYEACEAMCRIMRVLGIAIDGGKDSLSMAAKAGKETVKAPGTIVISCYAPCPDVSVSITPDLKGPAMNISTSLIVVTLSDHMRLGGTALAHCFKQLGNDCPDLEHPLRLREAFATTQSLLSDDVILAGHDVSDGGVITCVLEMAFAGNCGLALQLPAQAKSKVLEFLFNEEVSWVIEVREADVNKVVNMYEKMSGVRCHLLGTPTGYGCNAQITVTGASGENLLKATLGPLRDIWEETSYQLERYQCDIDCANEERNVIKTADKAPPYHITYDVTVPPRSLAPSTMRCCVLREEGVNSDRELAAALYRAGFEPWDVTMTDLINERVDFDGFRGIVFPGGFSYADVLGSARGWAAALMFDARLKAQMEAFRRKPSTFSIGICNGCQLMALLGWVAADEKGPDGVGVQLLQNRSGRFECRWSTVRIEKSRSILLQNMTGSILGVWTAHGEGRFAFRNDEVAKRQENDGLIAMRYVDFEGKPTQEYPHNPNGSPNAIAALCSEDGRHLALMPHPERCFLPWQVPYGFDKRKTDVSPWMKLFHNAFVWCQTHSK